MRVTDDRYNRDRLRLELALRLIGHEARTQTIRRWTGLSDDRIRKLYRAYIHPGAGVRRRRGKSPQQVAFFVRGGAGAEDAHALAAMLLLFGVIAPPAQAAAAPHSLARGRLLCEAFETYRRIVPQPAIDFEHAVYLAAALQRGQELRLRWCSVCDAVNITEHDALRPRACRACDGALGEAPAPRPALRTGLRGAGAADTARRGAVKLSTH